MAQEVTKRLLVKRSNDPTVHQQCSIVASLRVFATKWKPCILWYLAIKPMRYNDLYRIIPNISRKILSVHLKEMETDGIIMRLQLDEKRQHVEYSLSDKGRSLMPILIELQTWGLKNLNDVLSPDQMVPAELRDCHLG